MNIIGTFTKDDTGYTGSVHTIAYSGSVAFEAVTGKPVETSPDFRVFTRQNSRIQIGAAWKERSEAGNEYLAVRLDEPSFSAPIFCRLIRLEGQEGYSLIWSRS